MNPDTAPIAEVEAWLAPRLGWTKHPDKPGWYHDRKGMSTHLVVLIGPSIDAAVACLPKGRNWSCCDRYWYAYGDCAPVYTRRSNDPAKARDELLRLACKAWIEHEKTLQTADCPPSSKDGCQ